MSKSNEHKKDYQEDKFARNFYCQHARLNQLREDKKRGKTFAKLLDKRMKIWYNISVKGKEKSSLK